MTRIGTLRNTEGMSREQNIFMRQFARMALRLSKDNYDSNEVAVTWDLETGDSSDFGIAHGDEEHVNLAGDTATFHLLRSGDRVVLSRMAALLLSRKFDARCIQSAIMGTYNEKEQDYFIYNVIVSVLRIGRKYCKIEHRCI